MLIDRSGIILFVEHYDACINFYANVLALPVQFSTADLNMFKFAGFYLMEERGGVACTKGKEVVDNPCILRMNIADVAKAAETVQRFAVEVVCKEYDWGSIAKFTYPNGNICEFQDSREFDLQLASDGVGGSGFSPSFVG